MFHVLFFAVTSDITLKLELPDGKVLWLTPRGHLEKNILGGAYTLNLPYLRSQYNLTPRFLTENLQSFIIRHALSQEFFDILFKARPIFNRFVCTESDKYSNVLQVTGFSGVGKSYLLYETALLLSALPKTFRVLFVCHGPFLKNDCVFEQLFMLLGEIFPDIMSIDWGAWSEGPSTFQKFSRRILPLIKDHCAANNIYFIMIVDQVNELPFAGKYGSEVLKALYILAEYTYKTILCFTANNDENTPYTEKGTQVFLKYGFSREETVTFLKSSYFSIQCASTADFNEELLNQIEHYCSFSPFYLSLFKQSAQLEEDAINSPLNSIGPTAQLPYLFSNFCTFKLENTIMISFCKFTKNSSPERLPSFYESLYYLFCELPCPANYLLNKQFCFIDRDKIIRAFSPFVKKVVLNLYQIHFLDIFDRIARLYFESADDNNTHLGIILEKYVIHCIQVSKKFSFTTARKTFHEKLNISDTYYILDYCELFKHPRFLSGPSNVLFIPLSKTFKHVDFFIVNPDEQKCFIFQVTVNIGDHSPSATLFAKERMEEFKGYKYKHFMFYYLGYGDRIPAKDRASLTVKYESLGHVPLENCNHDSLKDIVKSQRWQIFLDNPRRKRRIHI